MQIKYSIKAFTVFELLLSMVLSSVLIAFAFMGFNQMQKLLQDYNAQSNFISEINLLHSALFRLSSQAKIIEKQDDNVIIFKSDSALNQVVINEKNILVCLTTHTDTFHFESKNNNFVFLTINEQTPTNLIKQFDCDIFFKNQKFHVSFQKQYDSESVLKSALELLPPDELN